MRRNSQILFFSFVLLLCILGSSSVYGQQMVGDTLEYPTLSYPIDDSIWMPLNIGNTYLWRYTTHRATSNSQSTYSVVIYTDTTTINGRLYIGKAPGPFYYYDTLHQVGLSGNDTLFDATIPDLTIWWRGNVYVYAYHDTTAVFGATVPVRGVYTRLSNIFGYDETTTAFAVGVGRYAIGNAYHYMGGPGGSNQTLLTALVFRKGQWLRLGVQGPQLTINPPSIISTPQFKMPITISHPYNGSDPCSQYGIYHFTSYRMYHSFYANSTDTIPIAPRSIALPCNSKTDTIRVTLDTAIMKTHSYYFKIHLKDASYWPQEKFFPDSGYFKIDYRPMVGVLDETEIPKAFSLSQNYPNPFNPVSTIMVMLPESMYAEVILYNVLGEKVKTLHSGMMSAGANHVELNASDLSSGLYYYTLRAGGFTDVKKCVVLK